MSVGYLCAPSLTVDFNFFSAVPLAVSLSLIFLTGILSLLHHLQLLFLLKKNVLSDANIFRLSDFLHLCVSNGCWGALPLTLQIFVCQDQGEICARVKFYFKLALVCHLTYNVIMLNFKSKNVLSKKKTPHTYQTWKTGCFDGGLFLPFMAYHL